MAAGVIGFVFVLLTARHLVRIAPNERSVIRVAEVGCLFLVICMELSLFHFPFNKIFGIVGFSLLAVAILVCLLKSQRGRF